jgi:hypothetical protein
MDDTLDKEIEQLLRAPVQEKKEPVLRKPIEAAVALGEQALGLAGAAATLPGKLKYRVNYQPAGIANV